MKKTQEGLAARERFSPAVWDDHAPIGATKYDASLVVERVPAKTMHAGWRGHTVHAVRSLEDRWLRGIR